SDSSEGRATVRVAISDVTDIEETRELRASEARFDQLAVQSGTVTWEADADGLFTYVSSVSEIVWGYHPHELVGKVHFYDLVIEAEREAIKSRVFEIAKHGEGFVGLEHAVHCKDGSVRWNSTSGIPLLKADGSIRGYQGSDTDVSERKVVEEELLKISQRLSLATRAGGVGIWDLDVINNKLIWDDQMFKLYGIEEAHFGGAYEAWKAGLFPEDAQRGDEEIQMALRDEKEFDTEFRVLWPNRTVHHIRALAVVQRDASGKPLRMMGTNWDITERKHAEETLRNASIKLGILNSITRHDITNQMLALTGFLELCKRREKDPRSMEYLEKMTRATENVQRQIAFTKEYQDIGVKAPAWVSPGRQTAEAFAMLHPEGVELEDRTEGVEVMADPLAEKVPYNLIDNSMRHGEHVTRIKMSAEQKDDALLIVYEDDGVGISAEDKKRLFEKGFGKNTGFGLFLTREILAITGITITETGKEGEGVRFELLVPAGAWQLRSE
ncbi:MAG: PAS domain-containing protein, partial [Methanomassiliicoccales archaeon]